MGWVALERPPFEYLNFLFYRSDEWAKYLESITDELVLGGSAFDLVVGSGPGTYATINDAIAAASVGSRIYVSIAQALTVTQVVDLDDIELTFAPGAVLTQATTLAKGLQIDAERVRVIRPRFTSWDNSSSDIPIEFTANAKNCILDNAYFFDIANTTNPVNDLGTNNSIINPVEEL